MDPLALLSDDDGDDAGASDTEPAPAVAGAQEADEKRARTDAAPQLDFEALRRAGYGPSAEEEEKQVAASFQSSCEALAAASEDKRRIVVPDDQPKKMARVRVSHDAGDGEFGCELPPDSVEVYDEQGLEEDKPWDSFDQCGLDPRLTQVMKDQGFKAPTPIQAHTWPILHGGRDLIGVAKTGSGKTLAFLLPFFSKLLEEGLKPRTEGDMPVQMLKQAAGAGSYSPDILVLAPSRELAMQIESEANKFTKAVGIMGLAAYGGEGLRRQQLGALRERPQCVVGTIGRLADFIENEKHWFSVKNVRFLILDEADLMIGEGLSDNIRKITVDVETPRRQTALFSATFDGEVSDLATWITRHAVEVRVGMKDPLRANLDIDQKIVIVKDDDDKAGCLKTLLRKQYASNARNPGKVLIFAGEAEECDVMSKKLASALNHANVEVLHGNRKQADREKALADFRSGKAPILIATGVAGRGLDVKDIQLVINYEPPEDGQDYVHRIGRTGRAGNKGTAITLLRKGPDGRAMIYIAQVMQRTGIAVPPDLIAALKQRRGRDMGLAAEALRGICSFEKVDRSWAKEF